MFVEVGNLEQRRYYHSLSLVNMDDYTCAEPPPTCNSFDTCITSPNYPGSYPNDADEVKWTHRNFTFDINCLYLYRPGHLLLMRDWELT